MERDFDKSGWLELRRTRWASAPQLPRGRLNGAATASTKTQNPQVTFLTPMRVYTLCYCHSHIR